jgi:hypothetical protein
MEHISNHHIISYKDDYIRRRGDGEQRRQNWTLNNKDHARNANDTTPSGIMTTLTNRFTFGHGSSDVPIRQLNQLPLAIKYEHGDNKRADNVPDGKRGQNRYHVNIQHE